MENPAATNFADEVMSLNRKDRRLFQKKNKLPFKVVGSNKPLTHGNPKAKETSKSNS